MRDALDRFRPRRRWGQNFLINQGAADAIVAAFRPRPDDLVMVQREVAERIASPHGRKSYGGLSVLCQAQARVERLLRLRPGSFRPIPKVGSELVRLTLHDTGAATSVIGAPVPFTLEALLRTAFAQRRKTLLNNLARLHGAGGDPLGPAAAADLIRGAGLDPRARPEEIPVGGFLALLRALRAL